MKTKRYMPVNLAGLALIAVLWQAEVHAQTAKLEEQRRDVKAPAGGHRKGGRRVVKRQHFNTSMRSGVLPSGLVY